MPKHDRKDSVRMSSESEYDFPETYTPTSFLDIEVRTSPRTRLAHILRQNELFRYLEHSADSELFHELFPMAELESHKARSVRKTKAK